MCHTVHTCVCVCVFVHFPLLATSYRFRMRLTNKRRTMMTMTATTAAVMMSAGRQYQNIQPKGYIVEWCRAQHNEHNDNSCCCCCSRSNSNYTDNNNSHTKIPERWLSGVTSFGNYTTGDFVVECTEAQNQTTFTQIHTHITRNMLCVRHTHTYIHRHRRSIGKHGAVRNIYVMFMVLYCWIHARISYAFIHLLEMHICSA